MRVISLSCGKVEAKTIKEPREFARFDYFTDSELQAGGVNQDTVTAIMNWYY